MSQNHLNRRLSSRHGIAPLEMVMSLPFLVGIVAMTASLGWTALYRSMSCAEARHEVWKMRGNPKQPPSALKKPSYKPTSELGMELTTLAGEVYGEVEHEITLSLGLGKATPKARASVLANNWDHKFLDGDFDGEGPHVNILVRMGPIILAGVGGDAIKLLAGGLLDMKKDNLPNKDAINAAQDEYNKAKNQYEELKKEHEKIIQDLKDKYAKVKAERDQLVQERQKLIEQRDQLNKKIAELEEKIANQNPPNPNLVKELNDTIAERNKLNQEINKKSQQITAKEKEMEKILEEIKQREDAMKQAQDEMDKLPPLP